MKELETRQDLHEFVLELIKAQKGKYKGSLEEYLRALWGALNQHRDEQPSLSLFGLLFEESFTTSPVPFDEEWMQYTKSAWSIINNAVPDKNKDTKETAEQHPLLNDPFEYLKTTLLFQIADLRRMSDNNTINNPYKYYGILSPTNEMWYNFHPFAYLRIGTSFGESSEASKQTEWSWIDLAWILMTGAFYE